MSRPMVDDRVSETVLKFEYKNNEVSRPSRITAKNAVVARATGPISEAESTFSCNSDFRNRADRFIQKTIQVTRATAAIDVVPEKSACECGLNPADVRERMKPRPMLIRTAAATPVHKGLRRARRSLLIM